MSQVLFLPLALSQDLDSVGGVLPPAIAARQIPRMLAGLVKSQGTHEAEFVPLVGNDDALMIGGRRAELTQHFSSVGAHFRIFILQLPNQRGGFGLGRRMKI